MWAAITRSISRGKWIASPSARTNISGTRRAWEGTPIRTDLHPDRPSREVTTRSTRFRKPRSLFCAERSLRERKSGCPRSQRVPQVSAGAPGLAAFARPGTIGRLRFLLLAKAARSGQPTRENISAFQNVFVVVQRDLLGLRRQERVYRSRAVPGDSDLPDSDHALSKISKYRNQHYKIIVHIALRDRHMYLDFAAIGRSGLILEVIFRHRRAIDPLVEEPVKASVALD